MKPGGSRTAKMTELFSRMQQAAQSSGKGSIIVSEWLKSDPGRQLAAIAYLRAFPEEVVPEELISAIERQLQSFAQYWALRVLNNLADTSGDSAFSPYDLRRLRELEGEMRKGTDRHDQVRTINRKLKNKSVAD